MRWRECEIRLEAPLRTTEWQAAVGKKERKEQKKEAKTETEEKESGGGGG